MPGWDQEAQTIDFPTKSSSKIKQEAFFPLANICLNMAGQIQYFIEPDVLKRQPYSYTTMSIQTYFLYTVFTIYNIYNYYSTKFLI